jgi:hypothetical protein
MALVEEQKLAVKANLAVMRCLDEQVRVLESSVLAKAKLREDDQALKTVSGWTWSWSSRCSKSPARWASTEQRLGRIRTVEYIERTLAGANYAVA